MRAQKRDANEPAIIAALEAIGCSVDPLPGGNGRPDLLVSARGCENILIEVKDGSKQPSERYLTPLQKRWHANWGGKVHIAETIDQALDIVAFYRKGRKAA